MLPADGRWTTNAEIRGEVGRHISQRIRRYTTIWTTTKSPSFTVIVKLRKWTWIGLGLIHFYYQRKLQKLCDEGRPAGTTGKVIVE